MTVIPRVRWMGSKDTLLPRLAHAIADVGGSTALDATNDDLNFPTQVDVATPRSEME